MGSPARKVNKLQPKTEKNGWHSPGIAPDFVLFTENLSSAKAIDAEAQPCHGPVARYGRSTLVTWPLRNSVGNYPWRWAGVLPRPMMCSTPRRPSLSPNASKKR